MSESWTLIVTCEHASNVVPRAYAALFRGHRALLATHRGHDIGAAELARRFARRFGAPLFRGRVTRLLIDVNRSIGHRGLFSSITRNLPAIERAAIIRRYYTPYRLDVEEAIRRLSARSGRILHLSVHTFTPVLDGTVRSADAGLLYDPKRESERRFVLAWRQRLMDAAPTLRVRRNSPYRGTSDGLTTYLRGRLHTPRYAGIELEVNQRFPLGNEATWRSLERTLVETFGQIVAEYNGSSIADRSAARGDAVGRRSG